MADNLTSEQKKEIDEKIGCAVEIQDAMQTLCKTMIVTLNRKDCNDFAKDIVNILTPCTTVIGNALAFTHAIIQSRISTIEKFTKNDEENKEDQQ